jgi:hypothetical protein
MTNPKSSRQTATRAKPAPADTPPPATPPATAAAPPALPPASDNGHDQLLQQLVRLTESVEKLAQRTTTPPPPPPPDDTPPPPPPPSTTSDPPDPARDTRNRVLFAYLFLGEVLGRRDFAVPRVNVERPASGKLKFTGLVTALGAATVVRLRAANNQTQTISGLQEDVEVTTTIPDTQRIDSIVFLTNDGVPVGVGDCEEPIEGVDLRRTRRQSVR